HVVADLVPNHLLDLAEVDRGHLVDEVAQLLDIDVREQVGSRGEQLPELDVSRPELFERFAKRACTFPGRLAVAADADLGEDASNTCVAGDAGDVERASRALNACPHGEHHSLAKEAGNRPWLREEGNGS